MVMKNTKIDDYELILLEHSQNITHVEKELEQMRIRAKFMSEKLRDFESSASHKMHNYTQWVIFFYFDVQY